MTIAYTDASRADTRDQPLTGRVLEGRYAVGLALGRGGMSTVYAGKQLRLDRDVAIKVLDPALHLNAEVSARFLLEAKLLSRIRHPNVIGVLDYGQTEEGLMYCVMELLVGSDLDQLLQRMPHGRMPWPGACDLLAQIADGLGAAHARGIVHRDVKPPNCFVSFEEGRSGVVKLLDFGVARAIHQDTVPKLTQAGLLLGTPSHIAPELLQTKGEATPASDLYALGVTAYRMLSGDIPFVGDTAFAQMTAACTEEPASLDDPDLDIPVELQHLVMSLLAKDPAKRPDDARRAAARFRVVAGDRPKTPLPVDWRDSGVGSPERLDVAPRTASPSELDRTAPVTLTAFTGTETLEEQAPELELIEPARPAWAPAAWVPAALLVAALVLVIVLVV